MSDSNMELVGENITSNKAMFDITVGFVFSQSFSECSISDYILSNLKV